MPVHDGGNGRLKHDLRLGVHVDHALFDSLVVADHALHAVAFYSVKIGQQQYVGDDFAFFPVKPKASNASRQSALSVS